MLLASVAQRSSDVAEDVLDLSAHYQQDPDNLWGSKRHAGQAAHS